MSLRQPAGTAIHAVELQLLALAALFRLFRLAAGTNTHHLHAGREGGRVKLPNPMNISFAASTFLSHGPRSRIGFTLTRVFGTFVLHDL